MKPVSPVIPEREYKEIIVAEHQDQYGNLPSIKLSGGELLSRWELTDEEKEQVAKNGYLYLRVWNYGGPLNPLLIHTDEPHPSELPQVPKPRPKHNHVEAYCLMKYRTEDRTEEEIIWNSRDGVTPFVVSSRSGKEMTHVEWRQDIYAPEHVPIIGERIFVDLTREIAEEAARANVERYWDQPNYPMSQAGYGSKEDAARRLADGYMKNPGEPTVLEVTRDWLEANNLLR